MQWPERQMVVLFIATRDATDRPSCPGTRESEERVRAQQRFAISIRHPSAIFSCGSSSTSTVAHLDLGGMAAGSGSGAEFFSAAEPLATCETRHCGRFDGMGDCPFSVISYICSNQEEGSRTLNRTDSQRLCVGPTVRWMLLSAEVYSDATDAVSNIHRKVSLCKAC